MELVKCKMCRSRTLPEIAARCWADGRCELCRDVEERWIIRDCMKRFRVKARARRCGFEGGDFDVWMDGADGVAHVYRMDWDEKTPGSRQQPAVSHQPEGGGSLPGADY